MTVSGGIRIGEGTWQAMNYSWPLVTLTASKDELIFTMPFKKLTFPRHEIGKISSYRGLWSDGVKIEHSSSSIPGFIVFWTPPSKVAGRLLSLGYVYEDANHEGSAASALQKLGVAIPSFILVALFTAILVHELGMQKGLPDALINAIALTTFIATVFFAARARILR